MVAIAGRANKPTTVSSNGDGVPLASLGGPKRRKNSWVIVGVVLVAVAALLGAYVFATVTDRISVLVAAVDLEPGVPIGESDLRVVEMGRTSELRAIQPDLQDLVLGQAPRGPIPAGTVLNTGLFVPRSEVLPAGTVVVGALLDAGAAPVSSLTTGDRVEMLATAPSSPTSSGGTALLLGDATVWSVQMMGSSESSSRLWVSLLVDESLHAPVAQAAADGRLRLGLVGS